MNSNKQLFGVLALGAAMATTALAQESKPVGLSVRFGAFFPSDSAAKDAGGKTWFMGGLEYKIKDLGIEERGNGQMLSASIDFYNKGGFSNTPLLLNITGHNNEFYYTGGVGVGFTKSPDGTGTKLAYQVGIGYNFQQGKSPLFVEAHYFGTSSSSFNGLALLVGIRI